MAKKRQEKRATLKKLRRDPRWNRCSLEYWKTSKRARNRSGGVRRGSGGGRVRAGHYL